MLTFFSSCTFRWPLYHLRYSYRWPFKSSNSTWHFHPLLKYIYKKLQYYMANIGELSPWWWDRQTDSQILTASKTDCAGILIGVSCYPYTQDVERLGGRCVRGVMCQGEVDVLYTETLEMKRDRWSMEQDR